MVGVPIRGVLARLGRPGRLAAAFAAAVLLLAACGDDDDAADGAAAADGEDGLVGLITKTDDNPFFVKMKEGAEGKAAELGVGLQAFAGRFNGDNPTQVAAVEDLIAAGANGILIVANDTSAIVPSLEQAREAGMLVIALDSPLEPPEAADATFATDNFIAGELIGQWAKAKFEAEGTEPKIAMLNLNPDQPTVDVLRNQGFFSGFGIDIGDPDLIGDEDDPRIVGQEVTGGDAEGGLEAMENLLQRDPDINLVYTMSEPVAAGAFEALQAAGVADQVTIVSVDGGCPGVEDVARGAIGATSMQFPLLMASLGVEAVAEFLETGEAPSGFVDTGVELITDEPVEGVPSEDTTFGLENCWG